MPVLNRVRTLCCVAFVALLLISPAGILAAGDKPEFRWKDNPQQGTADLLYGNDPALRYMYKLDLSSPDAAHETYKVYHHVFGPGNDQIITKGPGGLYTHHRGMFIGWNKTQFDGQTLDFWHMKNGAHQKHVKFLEKSGDAEQGTMTAEIHWNDPQGKPVIVEQRTVTVRPLRGVSDEGYAWQIDWRSRLQSQRGEIELTGDRQHAGFQFRAAQEAAEKNSARFLRPAGFPQKREAIQVGDAGDPPPHIDLNWFAMTFPLDGEQYTVEYFEDPALPNPSLYSERPYGRFGAFFKTTLAPNNPLTMRYRLIVSNGPTPERDEIQARYDRFVNELESE